MTTRLHFQFRDDAGDEARASTLRQLEGTGAARVQPLFPGDADPGLAALYVLEAADPAAAAALLALLRRSPAVAFAEHEARRGPR